uniref:FAD-binding oxidoreductase/transferase type 4 C-terminal domain-containing protein n=1 Tax=Ananas comosus var. bracteatus TaxID=296719 RepID=A0A6V7PBW8_ANACO|nr:unnamed protein product [Ananas comosus var. bracteatus]
MFEFTGTETYAREQTLIVQKIVSEHNGSDFVFVEDADAKKELWRIRKEALWACFAMAPDCAAMITDVCVPLSRLAECISKSKQQLAASPLTCTIIAHAGDGNFHTFILFDPKQEEQKREAERLNHFMVHTALSWKVISYIIMVIGIGTCTGEHAVGTGKMKVILEEELGMGALRTMKRIRPTGSEQYHESREVDSSSCLYLMLYKPWFPANILQRILIQSNGFFCGLHFPRFLP